MVLQNNYPYYNPYNQQPVGQYVMPIPQPIMIQQPYQPVYGVYPQPQAMQPPMVQQPVPQKQYYIPSSNTAQRYNDIIKTNPNPIIQQPTIYKPVNVIRQAIPVVQTEKTSPVKEISGQPKLDNIERPNSLKDMFHGNKAVIYALNIRSFNAQDVDGDSMVDLAKGEKKGTFLNAIDRLDELKNLGVTTLHLLPVNPPGKIGAMGLAGSLYAPADLLKVDPALIDPKSPLSAEDQVRLFSKEAHKRGIRIMLDLPSCASIDYYNNHPKNMAINPDSTPKIPQGWEDIRAFQPWADEEKRILNPNVLDLHRKFVDFTQDLGFDGIRADVARYKPVEFWQDIIGYARKKDPQFAFLAESYTYEDASPMANIPADRPEDLLRAGFDSYYGQYHIFNQMKTAKDLTDYVADNLKMSQKLPPNKSLIGSFVTHDDKSPMSNGGVAYCNLTTGLQATLPMTNPYFLSGFESGDTYIYPYANKTFNKSDTENNKATVHAEMLDIFNYSRKPGGDHPEIGDYMSKIMQIRKQYEPVITQGSFIPLQTSENKDDQIISYARHFNGKTLLVIANKDVNARQTGKVIVPSLKADQPLNDLSPNYEISSKYQANQNEVIVDLGPGKFHLFEIDTPTIEQNFKKEQVFKQNLDLQNQRSDELNKLYSAVLKPNAATLKQ